MLIFGLRSTSDDRPSDLSDKTGPKCKKRPPKLSSGSLLCYLLAVFCVIFFIIIIIIIIINLVTLTLSGNNNKEDNTEDCQKITQKTYRRLPENHQNIIILVTLILSGGAFAMFYWV